MLTIQNIGDLTGAQLNDWKVLEACEKQNPQRGENYYKIVLARMDNKGVMLDDRAGVIIDRNINPLLKGYHIKVVYESWDYEIHTTTWPALTIKGKDAFFGMILYRINEEYYKRNSK
jgi:hypothetical protein